MRKEKKKKGASLEKILDAACREFLEKGPSGTSMQDIASAAEVQKGLIYHYFENKEDLWKAVKRSLLGEEYKDFYEEGREGVLERQSWSSFLRDYLYRRFQLYNDNPAIPRLISWQRLEETEKKEKEGEGRPEVKTSLSLGSQLRYFQERGEISKDIPIDFLEYLILNVITLPFMAESNIFQGDRRDSYQEIYKERVFTFIAEFARKPFTLSSSGGINHLTLTCTNVDISFEFYKNILEFRPLVKWDKGAYFLTKDSWFCLNWDPLRVPEPSYTHYAFSISPVDFPRKVKQIRELGIEIFKENSSPGDSLYFLDPDGHKLELHTEDWMQRIERKKSDPGDWKDIQWFI